MKQSRITPSRRTPPRRTTPRRTTPGGTQRDAQEGWAAQAEDAPKEYAASSDDRLRATPPLSLSSGAGRQYWDEVLRLLAQIRADGDAAAERLGYVSAKDDGLATVEYIANKILQAVQGERDQQIARAKVKTSNQSFTDHKTRHKPQAGTGRAGDSAQSTLIGELKQMLRDGKTKAGVVIDPQLAHEIAKHITILNEDLPETPESMTRIRDSLARFFGKVPSTRTKPAKTPAVAENHKKTEPSRRKKPKKIETKVSVTKRSKGSKRRSR